MSKPTKEMTNEELIKELKATYPYVSDHNLWRFEDVYRELEDRGYDLNERHSIEIEKIANSIK